MKVIIMFIALIIMISIGNTYIAPIGEIVTTLYVMGCIILFCVMIAE